MLRQVSAHSYACKKNQKDYCHVNCILFIVNMFFLINFFAQLDEQTECEYLLEPRVP